MKGYTTLLSFFSLFLCWQTVCGSSISKGIGDFHIVTTYLPSYATVLISLGALLLLAYFVSGCVCCPNKSIKALSYQNGFPVSRLNENTFENPSEITIFPPHSTVIDLQPVSPAYPVFDDRVTFEPLPDILPKKFTTGQSAACSSRPAHFSALLKSKVSLHDWFDDPNSNFPREQLQYLQEIGIGWFGRVIEGEASQICDNEEKTAVIVKILREEASPSEHLHFLHEVRPYRDLKHSNVIKLLGRCLESDPFLLIMEHSISDLKTYLIRQEKRENFIQDGLMLQMISNIASGLRYMHDKGFCHMDLAAHNCFVCNDNSVKIGDYGISFDRWKSDYYCLGDIALPIRWYSPEILLCSETTIETKEITREANVWAFGVVLWEITELGKLPYEDLSDEEVLQKVLIEKSIQLSPPVSEIICKDEIVLVMRECWKPKKYRPSMEKIENFIMQLYNDRLSIKKQELSFEERWNAIQPRITEISSYTGTESSSLKFENDFSTRSDLQNYSSDNEILSSFEMSFDILPKTEFNGQLSPSLNVLNGSIDELTENDAYLNSISLSCGKYDADTLSNISDKDNFQMEEDKENSHTNNVISEQISAAIRDLDLVLASQPDSSRNSTLHKTKPVLHDSGVSVKGKELLANEPLKESQHLSKSSDLSNISESSLSKSSNFSDLVDHLAKGKCNDLSVNSDLNGNCSFYDNVSRDHSDIDFVELAYESDRHFSENMVLSGIQNESISTVIQGADKLYIKPESVNIEIELTDHPPTVDDGKLPSVPDIVIHESPSINAVESLEENAEFENNQCIDQNQTSPKVFRFVFKDTAEQFVGEISNQDFSEELTHELTESLEKNDKSKPLTSTPVKSSSDAISSHLNFENCNDSRNISPDYVFYEATVVPSSGKLDFEKLDHDSENCKAESTSYQECFNSITDFELKNKSPNLTDAESYQETSNSTDFDHFTTAQSSLLSKADDFTNINLSECDSLQNKTCLNHTENDITLNFIDTELTVNRKISEDIEAEKNNTSNTLYVSADNSTPKDYSKIMSDVISPPNGYVSSHEEINFSDEIENEYLEDSKASETVSPPQAFQDDGLVVLNDSYSESKASFDQDLSTSAECGSSENLDQYLEDDHISHANISAVKLLETSFPDMESKSFTYETCADFSGNMRPKKNPSSFSISDLGQRNSNLCHSDYTADGRHHNYNFYKNVKGPIQSYDQMIVEDLDTGEQTVINESYSVCDDYENSGESDEILKINTETDEAIIVDSSEALIGFVPSRSIELLQEFEVIPPLNPSYTLEEEKESSDSMNIDVYNSASPAAKHNSSPYESPERSYLQPYRNFCLQNEVIEEEITDEIVSPSSFHSSSSYCSNEIFMDEEKMSQSSESAHHGEMYETSVMPSVDHLYVVSDDGSKTDVSSSECSPVKQNEVVNAKYKRDADNNIADNDHDDVMHSYQPTQSVRWLSDETLDVDGDGQSPIIIEGREILAGDIIQTCELTAEDIASALSQLEAKGHLHGLTPNHLNVSQSPSPFSSVESSPCRDAVYTPDFESDSEESGSGTSCSSTSGSFECIHNKFKNTVDISKVVDESDKSVSSREQSPMKIFSKTWDCHATPTRGVLVTPEKKFNSMRKSVSFHEEDPQVVFEYPPASDSSEDGYPSDDNEEFRRNIDYLKYADWDLQAADADDIEAEEMVEIEELDSEPYVRRPTYSSSSVGPLNRPMLYTLTAGFSDEDFDLSETAPPFSVYAPSNSPDKEKSIPVSASEISKLIQSQLNDLADKENQENVMEDAVSSQISAKGSSCAPMTSVQESVVSSIEVGDIIIDELLPDCQSNCESVTVHKEDNAKSDFSKLNVSDDDDDDDEIEEVIIEEISDDESASDSFEFNLENKTIVLETDTIISHDKEYISEIPHEMLEVDGEVAVVGCAEKKTETSTLSDINVLCSPLKFEKSKETALCENLSEHIVLPVQDCKNENLDAILKSELNCNKVLIKNVQREDIGLKSVYAFDSVLHKEHVLSNDSISQDILKNAEKNLKEKTDSHQAIDNISKSMHVTLKSDISNCSDLQFNLPKSPVHDLSQKPDIKEQSSTNALNDTNNLTDISCDEIIAKSESPTHTNILAEKKKLTESTTQSSEIFVSVGINSTVEKCEKTCLNEATLSTVKNAKPEFSESILSNNDLSNAVKQSEIDTNFTVNHTNGIYESLMSDNSALINNTLNESSFSIKESVAQNNTQLSNSSSHTLADLSEVFFSPATAMHKVTDVQSSNNILCSSEGKTTSQSEILVDITDYDGKELSESTHVDMQHDSSEFLLHIPKIIVTPASESEVEDELEEYLRGQLDHFRSEASPQEDFSVTSEYSSRPFDDVFGSYISGDSSDYIEAFNFEFENGNFFEDYVSDYPHDLQTGVTDRLYANDGQQKRSSSLPLMTENLSDDDSLTMKSDSSLVYDTSKSITRL